MADDLRVLVIGADGTIGSAVAERLAASGTAVVRTSRRGTAGSLPLDLAAIPASWSPPPGVVAAVLCAAVTSTAACRDRPEEARRVNVEGTLELGRRLAAAGIRIVFPSTNMVFDGSVPFMPATGARCPRTAYGRMKAEAEAGLLSHGDTTVVRLAKVVGRTMPILEQWRDALGRREPIHPLTDLVIAPVSLDLASTVLAAAARETLGPFLQVSARADLSYTRIAVRLASRWEAAADLVRPTTSVDIGLGLEHVPAHTTLDPTTLRDRLGIEPPDPWAAIDEVA